MGPSRLSSVLFVCLLASLFRPVAALAQNWGFDARTVGMGGVGSTSNIAFDMVEEQKRYRSIVLPFGLFQILPNLPKLDPTKDEFDLVRAIEYAASPLHYTIGRDSTNSASAFVTDLRNGRLDRDLNVYRTFSPVTSITAEGLASPGWGYTFKFRKRDDGSFQGIYAGAGPYFSVQTASEIDPALAAIFSSPTPVYVPNTSFYMSNDTESQFALAITGGYRGRFAWPGRVPGTADRANLPPEGLYLGASYHYLYGFSYERFEPDARLDTNAQGLLFVDLAKGVPVSIVRNTSRRGSGLAVDVGVAAIVGEWAMGVGVNGIGNRIDWSGVERTSYVLDSLFNGGDFNDLPTIPVADLRVELPVDVRGNVAYSPGLWTTIVEVGHGFNGTSFRGGVERRFQGFQVRGGGRYIKERWEATGGAGVDLSKTFGVDVGLFTTSANFERKRQLAIAVSLRFMSDGSTRGPG